MAETSMREDLDAALDANEGDYEETEQEVITDTEPEPAPPADADTDDEPVIAEAEAVPADADAEAPSGDAEDTRSIKAPVDWSPKEREDWSRIPPHLQKKITARETEMQTTMAGTANARRTQQDFDNLSQKYGGVLSGVAGDTPMQAVENLFSTVSNLRLGTPTQKAGIIADLISTFGVDINTLDSALVGEQPQGPNAELESMLDQRMAPVNQLMQQLETANQQNTQNMQNTAINEVKQFADSGQGEFLADVRMDMADLIDMSQKRGEVLTIPEAYAKACTLNPQIQHVLAERQKTADLTGNSQMIGEKRLAASSVTGQRAGVPGAGAETRRDAIANAWDASRDG